MDKPAEDPAISVELAPDKAKAQVSDGALTKLGQAAAWLFPRKDAKAKITSALAERVANKIKVGTPLDEAERYFVGRMFDREARILSNSEQVAQQVQVVLPDVQARIGVQTESVAAINSARDFIARAETLAGEISEEQIRDVFARVLAGEISQPGSFSMRTLDVIRSLDQPTAKAFQQLCNYAIETHIILYGEDIASFLETKSLDTAARFELYDAGLVSDGGEQLALKEDESLELPYGDRTVRITFKSALKRVISIPPSISVLRLTRVGRDIARVLPFEPNYDYFDRMKSMLESELRGQGVVEWKPHTASEWISLSPHGDVS